MLPKTAEGCGSNRPPSDSVDLRSWVRVFILASSMTRCTTRTHYIEPISSANPWGWLSKVDPPKHPGPGEGLATVIFGEGASRQQRNTLEGQTWRELFVYPSMKRKVSRCVFPGFKEVQFVVDRVFRCVVRTYQDLNSRFTRKQDLSESIGRSVFQLYHIRSIPYHSTKQCAGCTYLRR